MESTAQMTRRRFETSLYRLTAYWGILLLVPGICLSGGLGLHEYLAHQQLDQELQRLAAVGLPIDNASTANKYRQQTSDVGTMEWAELINLVSFGSVCVVRGTELPHVGEGRIPELTPEGVWDDEPRVALFLAEMRPIIARMSAATQYETPVWQPIFFNGTATLREPFDSLRSAVRLLQLELDHALFQRDTQRAMASLKTMEYIARMGDTKLFIVVDLIHFSLVQAFHDSVRRSLSVALWSKEEIDILAGFLKQPDDYQTRWVTTLGNERAVFYLDEHARPNRPSWERWPSARWKSVRGFRQLEELGGRRFHELATAANNIESSGTSDLPAMSAYARELYNVEDSRRLTRVALAIKQFQMQQGDWPDALADLRAVGLGENDWSTVEMGLTFGYTASADKAMVWGVDSRFPNSIPQSIDESHADDEATPRTMVGTIR